LLPFIWQARYIIPLSKFKKKVEISSGSEDICEDGGLVKKILKPGDKYQHVDDYDYVLGINTFMIIFHFLFSHFLDLNWCYCFAVKYEARLDDGTLVKKSDDDGVEWSSHSTMVS
jgi:hypothetical protein